MTNNFFAHLILGHLIGDFFLQNKWMAMNKSANSFKCFVHCLIYTLAVTTTTWPDVHSLYWSILIFLSHFPIDRFSLADKWLALINGRTLTGFLKDGMTSIPKGVDPWNYGILRGGFASVVYTATDSTMHLVLMYYGVNLVI